MSGNWSGRTVVLIGAAAIVIGALLPWAKVASFLGTITMAGYEGDGIITGVIGVLLLLGALLYKGKPGRRYSIGSSIFALVAGVVSINAMLNLSGAVSDVNTDSLLNASIGSGLVLTALGSLVTFAGGLMTVPPSEEVQPS